jgi:branched-subunit amino acid aminotransferase/4-amino-4-deoxychorismate lyase
VESIQESAKALGLRVDEKELTEIPGEHGIWRWFVTETGTRTWWNEGIELPPAAYELDLAETGVWSTSWEARYKTLSYLNRIQAKREGGPADQERVMLNEKGEMASASMANLFWLRDGKLKTPARECGCRAGTVRRWVLERSGQRVEEGKWKLEELVGAEEIFLTNARIGIKPVRAWRGKKLTGSKLTAGLAEEFWKESR